MRRPGRYLRMEGLRGARGRRHGLLREARPRHRRRGRYDPRIGRRGQVRPRRERPAPRREVRRRTQCATHLVREDRRRIDRRPGGSARLLGRARRQRLARLDQFVAGGAEAIEIFAARGHFNYTVHDGGLVFIPHLSTSWQHEFLDQSQGITSQFNGIGAGSFVVNTPNPSRDSALVDVGLDTQINDALTAFVDYSVQAGQSNYFGQSVQAGFKIGF